MLSYERSTSCGFNAVPPLDARANHHENVRFITGESKEETMVVEKNKKNDEAAIQGLLDDCIRSLHDRNIDGVMSIYAQEVVSFDIVPPLQYIGADAFRKVWEETFLVYQGPIDYEIHDLSITVGDDVAFTHSLNRISGTMNNGQKTALWLRWTEIGRAHV